MITISKNLVKILLIGLFILSMGCKENSSTDCENTPPFFFSVVDKATNENLIYGEGNRYDLDSIKIYFLGNKEELLLTKTLPRNNTAIGFVLGLPTYTDYFVALGKGDTLHFQFNNFEHRESNDPECDSFVIDYGVTLDDEVICDPCEFWKGYKFETIAL